MQFAHKVLIGFSIKALKEFSRWLLQFAIQNLELAGQFLGRPDSKIQTDIYVRDVLMLLILKIKFDAKLLKTEKALGFCANSTLGKS